MDRDKVGLVAIAVFLLALAWILVSAVVRTAPVVTSFGECVEAGYPIREKMPRECVADETVFIEQTQSDAIPIAECAVAGCSSELCVEGAEAPYVVTTCLYQDSFACYPAFSRCERQHNGRCGWTMSEELAACIVDPASQLPDQEKKEVI